MNPLPTPARGGSATPGEALRIEPFADVAAIFDADLGHVWALQVVAMSGASSAFMPTTL